MLPPLKLSKINLCLGSDIETARYCDEIRFAVCMFLKHVTSRKCISYVIILTIQVRCLTYIDNVMGVTDYII